MNVESPDACKSKLNNRFSRQDLLSLEIRNEIHPSVSKKTPTLQKREGVSELRGLFRG